MTKRQQSFIDTEGTAVSAGPLEATAVAEVASVPLEPVDAPQTSPRTPVEGDTVIVAGEPARVIEALRDGRLRVEATEVLERQNVAPMNAWSRPESSRGRWGYRTPDGTIVPPGKALHTAPAAPTPPGPGASDLARHEGALAARRAAEAAEMVVEPVHLGSNNIVYFEYIDRYTGVHAVGRLEACPARVTRVGERGHLDLTVDLPLETLVAPGEWTRPSA